MTDNKDLTLRFFKEVFDNRNLAAIDELCAETFVEHTPMPGQPEGRAGIRWFMESLTTAFPDLTATVEDILAEGDRVAIRNTMHGTHKGEFMGIPPTGKHIAIPGIDLVIVKNGKATDHWGYFDTAGLLQQLGAIPPMS